jgi:O-succinylhomoserine sulfhydrylase
LIYSPVQTIPNTDELVAQGFCAPGKGAEDGRSPTRFWYGQRFFPPSMAAHLKAGDHVLASRAVFGSTHQILTQLLPRWGITHTYVAPEDIDTWGAPYSAQYADAGPGVAIQPRTDANRPGKGRGALPQTWAYFQYRQLFCDALPPTAARLGGADLVVHSATKWIDGQGRALAGLIVGSKELIEPVRFFTRHTGPALSPFNAWLLSKSLETLAVRMDRHCLNALELARRLEQQPGIQKTLYPFLPSHPQYELALKQMRQGGGIVTIEVEGGIERGRKFLNALHMCSRSANLGDARTIVTHPASTTHSKLTETERLASGITPGLIRISVGLEHVDDIWSDLQQALLLSR